MSGWIGSFEHGRFAVMACVFEDVDMADDPQPRTLSIASHVTATPHRMRKPPA
jgi:hypothetical protein